MSPSAAMLVPATKTWRAGYPERTGGGPGADGWQITLGLILHQLMEFLHYLFQVRETTLSGLGEDEAAIHRHLEATASAWD